MRSDLLIFLIVVSVFGSSVADVTCPIGWGSSQQIKISDDRINDGYCDCPTSGADEPDTDACAGYEYWPGSARSEDKTKPVTHLFTCPQQPELRLASSHLDDGICDCCDGADEPPTNCPNICDELLAEERAAIQRQLESFTAGAAKRVASLQTFRDLQQETREKLVKVEADANILQEELDRVRSLLQTGRRELLKDRLTTVTSRTVAVATSAVATAEGVADDHDRRGLLEGVTKDELVWMIVHACQISGEMSSHFRTDPRTCVPLRLAGLDASIVWESGTYDATLLGEDQHDFLGELLEFNLRHDDDNEKVWTRQALDRAQARRPKSKSKDRRRLDEVDEDIDDDDYDIEDAVPPKRRPPPPNANRNKNQQPDDKKRDEIQSLISNQPFSKERNVFVERAEALIKLINEVQDKEDAETDESDTAKEGEDKKGPHFDPMTLPMVKNQLDRRQKAIQRGLDYAVSAKVLLDELAESLPDDFEQLLHPLLVGTLSHGHLSVLHFWDIMARVLPEFQETTSQDDKTCRAPWSCPPRTIQRDAVTIPPAGVVKALELKCTQVTADLSQAACAAQDQPAEQGAIPADIPNGFAGYYWIEPVEESDFLYSLLGDLVLREAAVGETRLSELKELQEQVDKLEADQKSLQDSVAEMKDLVEAGPYGKDGELYALKDTCHSIDTGKYVYEVCLFGSAKQAEDKSSRGTDLGKWQGATVNDRGQRVWKWTDGAKCWKGPRRSATVYVTCGLENTILSADEPETCTYEFQMESYIACDEDFRARHHLPS